VLEVNRRAGRAKHRVSFRSSATRERSTEIGSCDTTDTLRAEFAARLDSLEKVVSVPSMPPLPGDLVVRVEALEASPAGPICEQKIKEYAEHVVMPLVMRAKSLSGTFRPSDECRQGPAR